MQNTFANIESNNKSILSTTQAHRCTYGGGGVAEVRGGMTLKKT